KTIVHNVHGTRDSDCSAVVIVLICKYKSPRRAPLHSTVYVQPRRCRSPAVPTESGGSGARHGADDAVRRHLADAVVVTICNEKVARRVHRDAKWYVQPGRRRWPAVPTESGVCGARHGADHAVRRPLADAAAGRLRDEE